MCQRKANGMVSLKKGKSNQQYEQSVTDEGKNVHPERSNWFREMG